MKQKKHVLLCFIISFSGTVSLASGKLSKKGEVEFTPLSQVVELESKVTSLKDTADTIQKNTVTLAEQEAATQSQVADLEIKLGLLNDTSDSLQQDTVSLTEQEAVTQSRVAELEARFAVLKNTSNSLQQDAAKLTEQEVATQSQIADLETGLATLKDTVHILLQDTATLSDQEVITQSQVSDLEARLALLKNVSDSLQQDSVKLTEQEVTTQSYVAELEARLVALQDTAHTFLQDIATLSEQETTAQSHIAELEQRVSSLKDLADSLQQEVAMKSHVTDLESQITSLKDIADSLQQDVTTIATRDIVTKAEMKDLETKLNTFIASTHTKQEALIKSLSTGGEGQVVIKEVVKEVVQEHDPAVISKVETLVHKVSELESMIYNSQGSSIADEDDRFLRKQKPKQSTSSNFQMRDLESRVQKLEYAIGIVADEHITRANPSPSLTAMLNKIETRLKVIESTIGSGTVTGPTVNISSTTGDVTIDSSQAVDIDAATDMNLATTAGDINVDSSQDTNITADQSVNVDAMEDVTIDAQRDVLISADSNASGSGKAVITAGNVSFSGLTDGDIGIGAANDLGLEAVGTVRVESIDKDVVIRADVDGDAAVGEGKVVITAGPISFSGLETGDVAIGAVNDLDLVTADVLAGAPGDDAGNITVKTGNGGDATGGSNSDGGDGGSILVTAGSGGALDGTGSDGDDGTVNITTGGLTPSATTAGSVGINSANELQLISENNITINSLSGVVNIEGLAVDNVVVDMVAGLMGTSAAGGSNGNGDNIKVFSGAGDGTGDGGDVIIRAEEGGATGLDGNVRVLTGGLAFAPALSDGDIGLKASGDIVLDAGGTIQVSGDIAASSLVGDLDLSLAGGDSSTAATDGGDVTITGGDSTTSGNGGDISLTAGTATSGNGGNVTISSNVGSGTDGTVAVIGAGGVNVMATTGELDLTATAGAVDINGDSVTINSADVVGVGNANGVTITGGAGGTTSGDGALVQVVSGGATSGSGGDLYLYAGDSAEGSGGTVSISAGTSASAGATDRSGGFITIDATNGVNNGAGGDVIITAGDAPGTGNGGSIDLICGSSASGVNGDVALRANAGTTSNTQNVSLMSFILHVLMSARIAPVVTGEIVTWANMDNKGVALLYPHTTFDGNTLALTLDRDAGTLTGTRDGGATGISGSPLTLGDGSTMTLATANSHLFNVSWEKSGLISVAYQPALNSSSSNGTYPSNLTVFDDTGLSQTTSFGVGDAVLDVTYNTSAGTLTVADGGGGRILNIANSPMVKGGTAITFDVDVNQNGSATSGADDSVTLAWNSDGTIVVTTTPIP